MKWVWIAVAIVITVGLLATGILFHRHWCQVTYSFDLGSVLDAAVFLGVGAFIEYAYQKRSSDKRADTDLLIELASEAKDRFQELLEAARSCGTEHRLSVKQSKAILAADRDLSNAIHSLEEGLAHCESKVANLQFQRLNDARIEIKDSLTDPPYPGPYDSATLLRIRSAFESFRRELIRIRFAINRR